MLEVRVRVKVFSLENDGVMVFFFCEVNKECWWYDDISNECWMCDMLEDE